MLTCHFSKLGAVACLSAVSSMLEAFEHFIERQSLNEVRSLILLFRQLKFERSISSSQRLSTLKL